MLAQTDKNFAKHVSGKAAEQPKRWSGADLVSTLRANCPGDHSRVTTVACMPLSGTLDCSAPPHFSLATASPCRATPSVRELGRVNSGGRSASIGVSRCLNQKRQSVVQAEAWVTYGLRKSVPSGPHAREVHATFRYERFLGIAFSCVPHHLTIRCVKVLSHL
jgi:hypothetical protein